MSTMIFSTTGVRRPSPRLRAFLLAIATSVALTSIGCAAGEFRFGDPFDREETLSEAQHRYTTLVRFSEFQKARSFVIEDEQETYRQQMKLLREARFTDFESESIELEDGKDAATIFVQYTVYTSALPYEVEVEEKQEWTRDGITNRWRLRSTFDGLQKLALN
jgi:hypothetical protein